VFLVRMTKRIGNLIVLVRDRRAFQRRITIRNVQITMLHTRLNAPRQPLLELNEETA
jgi:hypothetical protein